MLRKDLMNASMARLAHSMSMSFIRVSLIATLKIMMSVRTSVAKRYAAACANGILFARFLAPFALRPTDVGHISSPFKGLINEEV
ncbi:MULTISPECIES: hypothetical protein [unclassified Sphingopyxis]|uniref:hypothetical protein n=2 Tax=Alphaproteobacteria TaxID=28211 RepID=UPI000AF84B9E|nr:MULTISPECIES: hypothetical protein [unclassified Sphingopyxis]